MVESPKRAGKVIEKHLDKIAKKSGINAEVKHGDS